MISQLRKLKTSLKQRYLIKTAFLNDYKEYLKWQYNNPAITSKNAYEAKILRQTHIIEKGMSLSAPRERFGVEKACELIDFMMEYVDIGYKVEESSVVKNAIGVVEAYLAFHSKRDFFPEEVIQRYNQLFEKVFIEKLQYEEGTYGIKYTTRDDVEESAKGDFLRFFNSRHSIRQFSDTLVTNDEIRKAVELAMKAPSACNRQTCKVYAYDQKEINQQLGELIAGNTGFDKEVQKYLVVTSDLSGFYNAFERNQIYVDGGIFALALTQSLHYYGIASCILQNGEYKERNQKIKEICKNIPQNEKIILFIAIGHYKEEFSYASSHRKELDEVLKISQNNQ